MAMERIGAFSAALVSGLALAGGVAQSVESAPVTAGGVLDCRRFPPPAKNNNHEREACIAYIGNDAEIALQGIYKYGNSRVSYLADAAKHHFETRYFDGPRTTVEKSVDSWPKTSSFAGNRVDEDIDLITLSSNLKADRALIRTSEQWDVYGENGIRLYHEPRAEHNATLCRGKLPGHVLHEWFVVKFVQDPKFNCIAFDKRNGIAP